MSIAFVLGNGVSRKTISLTSLRQRGKIYGCNGLYRDFVPDVLVATDKPIATQIQESGYSAKYKFYTRKPINGPGAYPVPTEYYGFSSGPIAVGISAIDLNRRIYLLGFDMGPDINQMFNNVYADTEFYKKSGSTPTFTGNWIKQLVKVCSDFPKTNFYRICGQTTACITELNSLPNLIHRDIGTFLDQINNQKDL